MNLDVYVEGDTPFKLASTVVPVTPRDSIDVFNECIIEKVKTLYSTINKASKQLDHQQRSYYNLITKLQSKKQVVTHKFGQMMQHCAVAP